MYGGVIYGVLVLPITIANSTIYSISISPTCLSPQSEDDIELYRNIISKRFSAFVACIIDTMHLLGIKFIINLPNLSDHDPDLNIHSLINSIIML